MIASLGRTARVLGLLAAACLLGLGIVATPAIAQGRGEQRAQEFTTTFHLERCTLSPNGRNLFFSLIPGTQQTLVGEEDGAVVTVIITVLDRTEAVNGVTTRVVEEREFVDGAIAEISRNFYAMCRENNSVFYFGEDVDIYEHGQIISHAGAWRAGVNGAQPGLIMPGLPLLGARYSQEVAPEVALDRAEVVSLTARADVPAGTFDACLQTVETTPLEPGARGLKVYCPGVGLTQDESLELVRYDLPGQP